MHSVDVHWNVDWNRIHFVHTGFQTSRVWWRQSTSCNQSNSANCCMFVLPCWQVCAPQSIPDLVKFAQNCTVSHHPCSFVCAYTPVTDFISFALQPALATALLTVELPKTTFIRSSFDQCFLFEHGQVWLLEVSHVLMFSVTCLLAKPVRRADTDQNHLPRWFGWMWIKWASALKAHYVWTLECALKRIECIFMNKRGHAFTQLLLGRCKAGFLAEKCTRLC